MNASELICLSSDEDEPQVKKRKIAPILLEPQTIHVEKEESKDGPIIYCIDSDEDTNSQDVLNKDNLKEKGELTRSPENKLNEKDAAHNEGKLPGNETPDESCVDDFSKSEILEVRSDELPAANTLEISSAPQEFEKLISPSEDKTQEMSHTPDDNVLSSMDDLPSEARKFLLTCRTLLEKTTYGEIIFKKFPVLIKMFTELKNEFSESEYLKNFMNKQTKIAKESVNSCIVSFRDVYHHLKSSLDSEGVELSKKHWKHVRKLEEVMQKLLEKLNELNNTEIDFDADEDDSPYIKHARYSQRLCNVYKKYCQILKRNPYAGRITHERLDFVSSNYNEINLAISRKYKNNRIFPSYEELAAYIQETVQHNEVPLSSTELKVESEMCFKKLGELLQLRRKKELYEIHCSFIMDQADPAEKDKELDTKLRISSKEGKVKIEQVCQEFVRKQELGICDEEVNCSDENSDCEEDNDSDELNNHVTL